VTVEVRRSVGPPHRPALAERPLGLIDGGVGLGCRRAILTETRRADRAPRRHQGVHETLPLVA
jgi:hypothetical protein